ncbi:MAG TPA: hypothetical protein VF547_06205 [Allosphingosinicella sp.]|jgi:hypothetical protein
MGSEARPARRGVRTARRLLYALAGAFCLGVAGLALLPSGQREDRRWQPTLAAPHHVGSHPSVCFDEGHYNAHRATGRYRPLARLLEADGYRIERHRGRFGAASLRRCDLVVIANAAGGDRFRLGPINLPIKRGGERGDPAFSAAEIDVLRRWVEGGGSLLLVADHAPFGGAARALGAAFGVEIGGGFVEVSPAGPAAAGMGAALFTAANGLLRPHPITAGLKAVKSFTGQSLAGAGTPLLVLPPDAVEYVPPGPRLKPVRAGGRAQAVALAHGRGRVVVLGEAAMITAQLDDSGKPFGMNLPGIDNQAFALNLFHWLSRAP